jgi:hypothetical protein
MIETAMVRLREGDDEFVRSLIASEYFNILLSEAAGIHHGHELVKQTRLLLDPWNAVPSLGFAPEHLKSAVGLFSHNRTVFIRLDEGT